MNCQKAQDCLLRLEPMKLPPETVRVHVAACDDCTAWQRRVAEVDQQIQGLRVPAVRRKDEFIREFLDQATQPTILPIIPSARPTHRKQRGLRKLAGALALASAFLFVLLGWWLSHYFKNPTPDNGKQPPVVAKKPTPLQFRLRRDPRWKSAKSAKERLAILQDLRADVFKEAKAFAERKHGQQLLARADLFDALVRDGIVRQAKQLPAADRNEVLQPLILDLMRTESEARRRAIASEDQLAKDALVAIATSAERGAGQLRALL